MNKREKYVYNDTLLKGVLEKYYDYDKVVAVYIDNSEWKCPIRRTWPENVAVRVALRKSKNIYKVVLLHYDHKNEYYFEFVYGKKKIKKI